MSAEQLQFFAENGYVIVPNALTVEEVCTINDIIDRDLVARPTLWRGDPNAKYQALNILLANPELDFTMRPLNLLSLMEAIMGSDICADEHTIMIRAANPDGPHGVRLAPGLLWRGTASTLLHPLSVHRLLPDGCRRHHSHLQHPAR